MEIFEIDTGKALDYYFDNDLTDGLPIVLPTKLRVEEMLAGGGVSADDVLGSVPSRQRTVTAGLTAVNAVMAGCRADYFPVVLAAVRAMLDPLWNAHGALTSTGGAAACLIVSGPMAKAIGLNSKSNLFGPGFRANATIGRAVRLVAMNVLGARTGVYDESCLGTPAKFTFCFAEEEPAAPWQPLREHLGFERADTTVTIMASEGPRQIGNFTQGDPALLLKSFASLMKPAGSLIAGKGGLGVMVLGPEHQFVVRDKGWTQQQIREFLVENTRVTPEELSGAGAIQEEEGAHHHIKVGPDGKYPTFKSVDDLLLVTAGGHGAGWSAFIPSFAPSQHSKFATRRVVPAGEALPDCGSDACEVVLPSLQAVK